MPHRPSDATGGVRLATSCLLAVFPWRLLLCHSTKRVDSAAKPDKILAECEGSIKKEMSDIFQGGK